MSASTALVNKPESIGQYHGRTELLGASPLVLLRIYEAEGFINYLKPIKW
ncbi:MAG: hypothetical protein IPQ04_11955 [Saprospiraceae bacterium]|nr:hypothetical protein [Saprospiraceae bacterium]